MMTMTILSASTLNVVSGAGDASTLRVIGLRSQSLIDCVSGLFCLFCALC